MTSTSSSTSATAVTSSAEGTVITNEGQAISIKSTNSLLNRLYSPIYTFAVTRPNYIVSTLEIDFPDIITGNANGFICKHQPYAPNYNYFDLTVKEGTNIVLCQIKGQKVEISNLTEVMYQLTSNSVLILTVSGLLNPKNSVSQVNFTFTFIKTTSMYTRFSPFCYLMISASQSAPTRL